MMIAKTSDNGSWLAQAALAALLVAALFLGCKLSTYDVGLSSVTVTPANPCMAPATVQQFTATAKFADGTERDITSEAAWTSSDTNVATVSSGGLATPGQPGTTTITASLQGQSGSTTLSCAPLLSINVTPPSPSIANGTRIQFTATGHFDGTCTQDLTSQASWTSSDSSVTVSTTGLATSTALGAATSTIRATLGDIYDETALTVKAATLTSLSVSPTTATIKVGGTQQFAAVGTFLDSSTSNTFTQYLTNEATWNSSDPSVATISSTGLATGRFAGSTTITATFSSALLGSQSGSAALTVKTSSGGY